MSSCDGVGDTRGGLAPLSLLACLGRGYREFPTRRMCVMPQGDMSYAEAYVEAVALARHMESALGIGPGSTVILSCPNLMRTPVVLAAAEALGTRIALVPYSFSREDFARFASICGPDLIIAASAHDCETAYEIAPDACIMSIAQRCPGFSRVDDAVRAMPADAGARMAARHAAAARFIVFSSGTTGLPKAIVNRASAFARNASRLCEALSIGSDDVAFVPVPIAHVFGIVGLYAALAAGATFATMGRYTPEDACALIEATQATVHMGVPTMYARELRVGRGGAGDLSSLRVGVVGGASCPEPVLVGFEEEYGCRLMPSYGMSETAATLTVTDVSLPASERAATDGVAIDGAHIRVLPDTGEVLCKTPSMMEGIIEADGSFSRGVDGEGWLHTGDVGEISPDGSLRIVGRIKEMVIRGGVNVFPAEVERLYAAHPDIAESCLVGYADAELGERSALAVVLKDGASPSSLDLRLWAKGRIEKAKIPDIVIKMDDFPRLASGKIDKKALKRQVGETVARIGAIGAGRAGARDTDAG